ncbi:hypothetical protein Fmac_011554 [Flemingia macrophylla]|uniref:High chlorophyll fluorescence 153 n=1 Tax=Flemingia macrophylla TaxID=520843 RepID=A0ABD1MMR9_9FABA
MGTLLCVSNPMLAFASLRLRAPLLKSPVVGIPAGGRNRRGSAVAARAGPTMKSILFAIALPSSLLGVTILAALRMGDKLDRDWLLEMAKNEAAMEIDEFDDENDDEDNDDNNDNGVDEINSTETYVQQPARQEEPALRNRPKREA